MATRLAWGCDRGERDKAPTDARWLFIGKTWDAIRYLLHLADGPVELVDGLASMAPLASLDGCVCYLDTERVRRVADWLAAVSFDDLIESADPNDPNRRHVYKVDLDNPGSLTWVRECYESLAQFSAAATRHGEAILILKY